MIKPFQKKLIFGIFLIIGIDALLLYFIFTEHSGEFWELKLFLLAFKGGVIVWIILNYRESQKVKAKRQNEKSRA